MKTTIFLRNCVNRLLLTCVIAASAGSLHGMEIQKQPSPITLPLTYYHFSHDVLPPEIAQQIFVKLFETHGIDLAQLPHEIEQRCKNDYWLVKYINKLIKLCGYLLASELCERFFPHAKVSIWIEGFPNWKHTPLHYVVEYNCLEVAQILLKIAGDKASTLLTMQDYSGWTALHFAAYKNNTENVKLLLGVAGNKVWELLSMKSNYDSTSLHCANNNTETIKLLLDAAGDNAPTLLAMKRGDGETAFDLANSETKEVMRKYMTH